MTNLSPTRLIILRTMYLILALGAGSLSWRLIADPQAHFELMHGMAVCMLAAFSVLCLLGVRDPLRMLPVLLWEIIWKTVWLLRIALPAWRAGRIDDGLAANIFACGFVVLIVAVVPWRYVWDTYIRPRQRRSSAGDVGVVVS